MIELRDLTLGYGRKTILSGLSERFVRGESVALLGRNGAGKSTLLRAMTGLEKPVDGEIFIDGISLKTLSHREIARSVSFVSTEYAVVHNLSVVDMVALGRAPHTGWRGMLTNDDRRVVSEALELTGLTEYAPRGIDTLSDGERQRAMIARALAQNTPVILLDEPTAFLDHWTRRDVSELLVRLANEQGKTIVFSSHDLALVDELAVRKFLLHN